MRILLTFLLFGLLANLSAQNDFNIDLVAHVPSNENLSDVWGFVAEDGTEYGIIGTRSSTEVYSLADPSKPELVSRVEGAPSVWRDIKVLGNYIYITTDEGTDGVTIINMTEAPGNITSTKVNPVVNGIAIETCHNLYIDTATQVMFLAGCNGNRGVLAFDITTAPEIPQLINVISTEYSHDVFVRDNIAFSSEIFGGEFAIYDINDIMSPVRLGSANTTNFFTHNAWSSEDNQYLYTTDEVGNGTIDAFDISDFNNPVRVDVFVPKAIQGKGVVPHNTHWLDDFLVTSWYTYGIVISDVSNPDKIVEVGHYDTGVSPDCWGAYPFLPSGLILASDIDNGFYVLQPTYTRASYVSGLVTDASDGIPIFDAKVIIQAPEEFLDRTDPMGAYVAGDLQTGTFQMLVLHPDYVPQTLEVNLVQGETQEINIALVKEAIHTQTIKCVDASTGEAIPNASISMTKDELVISELTNADGEASGMYVGGSFQILAGAWGYKYKVLNVDFDSDGEYTLELDRGFQDDFVFDYGWTNVTPNVRSEWVREIPNGTTFGGQQSNPFEDVDDDIGEICYITGNGTGGAGSFDVDNGSSILTSPIMDLSDNPNAVLSFRPWFFNEGGSGLAPNDSYEIFVTDGDDTVSIVEITDNTNGWADALVFKLSDFIALNEQVQIVFKASDDVDNGHLVEAGLDQFFVSLNGEVSSAEEISFASNWEVFPNPTAFDLTISHESFVGQVNVAIYSASGSLFYSQSHTGGTFHIEAPEISGLYVMKIVAEDGMVFNKKITVLRD